jgi:hypothetical protein
MGSTEDSINQLSDLLNIEGIEGEALPAVIDPEIARERVRALKRDLKELGKLDDKNYAKQVMKRMVERGFSVLDLLEQEMEKDVFARDAEVAGQLLNSITDIVTKINQLDIEDKKLELQERKVKVAENKVLPDPDGNTTNIQNNIIGVGTTSDLIRALLGAETPASPKEIDVSVNSDV